MSVNSSKRNDHVGVRFKWRRERWRVRRRSNPRCTDLSIPSELRVLGSTTFPNPSTYFCMSNTDNDMAQASHIDEWARCMPGPVKQATQTKGINIGRLGKQQRHVGKRIKN